MMVIRILYKQGALLLLCLLSCVDVAAGSGWEERAARELERLLESRPEYPRELAEPALVEFYRGRAYRLLWSNDKGRLNRAYDLMHAIIRAPREGLESADYFLDDIRKFWNTTGPDDAVQVDLLLSAALYRYASDVHSGWFDPQEVDPDWHIRSAPLDAAQLFEEVAGRATIDRVLEALAPDHAGYRALKEQLRRYREIERQGGWERLPRMPVLERDAQHPLIPQLRQRLAQTGDMEVDPFPGSEVYDRWVEGAVLRYQQRHGLDADGKLGSKTRRALNIDVADRIRQIRANMERWRWLPRELGRRYLVVNMTGFELYIMEHDSAVLTMPVIIGKAYRSTPMISGVISYMEYNPYWTIPETLAWEDFIPRQMRDPYFFDKRSIHVFRGWAEAREIDPRSVDWSELDREDFPYWLRQDPGPRNALGRVKFIFSNPYRIYLHGTPDKHLFERTVRTYSSGCIRVKDPVRLAAYLLNDGSQQKEEEVLESIHLGTSRKVTLPVAVPIYLLYWTAWVDAEGRLNFRDDVYGRNVLLNRLFEI